MGDLGQKVDAFLMARTGPGSLLFDYGDSGRFTLTVAGQPVAVADTA
jgi:hypothetical protein